MEKSIWVDDLCQELIIENKSGSLLKDDSLCGVTVGAASLQKTILNDSNYDEAVNQLIFEGYHSTEIYEKLIIDNARHLADFLQEIYEKTNGKHGFVSLEIPPDLAYDTEGIIENARRYWQELDRSNVMIKIPATLEGLPAMSRLLEDGINVDIYFLFDLARYRQAVETYLASLQMRMINGKPLSHIQSMASFYLDALEGVIYPMLDQIRDQDDWRAPVAAGLKNRFTTACAFVAGQIYQENFTSEDFRWLVDEGARPQRLLWAMGRGRSNDFSAPKYFDALIGSGVINFLPVRNLHYQALPESDLSPIEYTIDEAQEVFDQLSGIGIDLDQLTRELEAEAVAKTQKAYRELLKAIDEQRRYVFKSSPKDGSAAKVK